MTATKTRFYSFPVNIYLVTNPVLLAPDFCPAPAPFTENVRTNTKQLYDVKINQTAELPSELSTSNSVFSFLSKIQNLAKDTGLANPYQRHADSAINKNMVKLNPIPSTEGYCSTADTLQNNIVKEESFYLSSRAVPDQNIGETAGIHASKLHITTTLANYQLKMTNNTCRGSLSDLFL